MHVTCFGQRVPRVSLPTHQPTWLCILPHPLVGPLPTHLHYPHAHSLTTQGIAFGWEHEGQSAKSKQERAGWAVGSLPEALGPGSCSSSVSADAERCQVCLCPPPTCCMTTIGVVNVIKHFSGCDHMGLCGGGARVA